jgi:hypothetical protein
VLLVVTVDAWAQTERPIRNGREGPPTPDTCYWTSREYKDIPERGPAEAAGIVLWNHGQHSKVPTWQNAPSPVMRLFAERGWEIRLIQRNERCESTWEFKGGDYVANLVREVNRARADGYKRLLTAGQSYGAGIALGASGSTDRIDGVLAFALSHGRGSCRDAFKIKQGMIDTQAGYIRDGIQQARSPRLLISMGADDQCVGHSFTPMIDAELAKKQAAYIHFDESMPFTGHQAANLPAYAKLFGDCIFGFFTQVPGPSVGRTFCPQ